jgi:hypothetical protein
MPSTGPPIVPSVGYVVGRDVFNGFMSMSRFIVTFVGCVTMLGAAAIFSNDTARARFVEHAPALVGHWLYRRHPSPSRPAAMNKPAPRSPRRWRLAWSRSSDM